MPRKTNLSPAPTALPQRPAPPAGLPQPAQKLWRAIVLDYPVGHFTAANLVLLEQFCRARALVHDCDQVLADEGLFREGKPHRAIAVRALGWSEMRHCATKLRLAISSVARAEIAGVRPSAANALRKPWA